MFVLKKYVWLLGLFVLLSGPAGGQANAMRPPDDFDVVREKVPKGKVETVEYMSGTVGGKRKATVYTRRAFRKTGNTGCYICFTVLAEMRKNGIITGIPTLFSIIFMPKKN